MTDSIREQLARVLCAAWGDKNANSRGLSFGHLADAILADPDLLVLRREDVTQVGWHWLPEGSGCWAPVFLVNGYEP